VAKSFFSGRVFLQKKRPLRKKISARNVLAFLAKLRVDILKDALDVIQFFF
jgi:hypothetical protein